jgi:c-di-GMP-binding flagellar brake protein YcgR
VPERDRRRFLRVEAEFPVGCRRIGEDGALGEPFTGTTVNVSAGGIKMRAPQALEVGDRVRLEIRFGRPPFLVFTDARVVRVEPEEEGRVACALEFDRLDTYIEQRIVRWTYAEDRREADRRAAVRVPLNVIVTCRARGEAFRAGTIDIAVDGARIVTDRVLEPGEPVELDLELEELGYALAARSHVVWGRQLDSGRFTYGLRFEGLDPRTQRELVARAAEAERRASERGR